MKILVLGLGNELYGDDAAGIHTIRRLKQERLREGRTDWADGVEFTETSLSGLALLDLLIGHDALLIIDTIQKEQPSPGKIHQLGEKDLRSLPGPSPHYVSVPQALEIGRQLGLKVPGEIRVLAVEAKNTFCLGEGLSKAMVEALPKITKRAKKLLLSMKKGPEKEG
jgi:hydrogenase maturation protease